MTFEVRVDTRDLTAFGDALDTAGARAATRTRGVVRHYGQLAQTSIKRRAALPRSHPRGAGTGGPRLITGDYNRSIALQLSGNAAVSTATIGTNKPQGRRLELGFVGVDSAGRHYRQPPYPHFGPGLEDVREPFLKAIEQLAGEGLE